MKRNSGLIGPLTNAVITAAPGVFDTFDAYNFRKNGNWPLSFRYNSLSTNSGTILENSVINLTFNTSGFEVSTTLYWNILHITTGNTDFFGSTASGSFTQNAPSNSGGFSIITALIGDTSKSSRTFQIEIRTGSSSGPVVYTSGTFNIPAITSTVSWTVTPVNEGSNTNLQVFLGNVGNYTTYVANISYTGTAGAFDFNNLPSSINIGSGTFTVIYTALADLTTEGTETLTATVRFGASSFLLGNPTLTISDISTNVSATVTPTLTSVNEDGTAVTFNVSTTGFTSGTLYWTVLGISGTLNSADFTQGNIGGSFSITSSAGSFVLNIAADAATEGTETFQVQVRTVSTSGTVVGTSGTITIADTSIGATATIIPTSTSVNEDGTAVTFNVSTTNFTSGTLYYTVLGISGTLNSADFTQPIAGSFSITSSAGSFVLNIAADAATEGTETFQVQVRTVSTSGTVIGTSGTITIADTSLGAVVAWSNPIIATVGSASGTNAGVISNYYRRHIVSFSYTQAEMQAILGTSNVQLYGLRFFVTSVPTYQPYPTYAVGMKNGSFSGAYPGTTGWTIVSDQQTQSFTSGYKEILFPTPFLWTASSDLAIVTAWGQCPSSYSNSGTTRIGAGNLYYGRTDGFGTYTINVDGSGAAVQSGIRPVLEFKLSP